MRRERFTLHYYTAAWDPPLLAGGSGCGGVWRAHRPQVGLRRSAPAAGRDALHSWPAATSPAGAGQQLAARRLASMRPAWKRSSPGAAAGAHAASAGASDAAATLLNWKAVVAYDGTDFSVRPMETCRDGIAYLTGGRIRCRLLQAGVCGHCTCCEFSGLQTAQTG